MRFHLIRVLGLVVGLTAVLAMASIAAAAPLSDQQLSRQIENRLSKDDAFENVTGAAAVELEKVTVPAGTRLMIGLDDALDTGENKDGDRFSGFLDAAVSVDGTTAVPRGTKVYGRLREVKKAGRFRGKAELVVELTDIRLDDQLIPIMTDRIRIDGDTAKTLQKVGGGAVAGAVVGAVVDGADGGARGAAIGAGVGIVAAAITGGQQVKLKPETLLEFRLDQEVTINAP